MITARVLFFGAARDIVGSESKEITLISGISANAALQQILEKFPDLHQKFGKSLLFAVNQSYARGEEIIQHNDELAIFPPVSGGSGETRDSEFRIQNGNDFFELTLESIDVGRVASRAYLPECGATVSLDGYVRRWTKERETLYLVYEAYAPMAISEMQKLGRRAHEQFEIAHIGIVHRLGRLEVGETSVVISVSAPHRESAFEACAWVIKELKRTVPIWKKEFYADGNVTNSAWSAGENPPAPDSPYIIKMCEKKEEWRF